jgi:hypothetical protein
VHILPDVMMPARRSEDPGDTSAFDALEPKLKLLSEDLAWWARALHVARVASER